MHFLSQSLVISASLLLAFVWQQTALINYTIPAIGLFIFMYIILFFLKKESSFSHSTLQHEYIGVFILTTVISLLIFATNSINSTFFFLLYFLSFGIAFILKPAVVFSFSLGVILVFLPDALKNNLIEDLIKLGSFVLISPLAFFFGTEFRKRQDQDEHLAAIEERTLDAANTISKDVERVLINEKQNLKKEDVEKLNEILEETEDLRQETR